jgi:hypothetical protein
VWVEDVMLDHEENVEDDLQKLGHKFGVNTVFLILAKLFWSKLNKKTTNLEK